VPFEPCRLPVPLELCRSSLAVRALPSSYCFRFRVASRRRASHRGVRPLLTGPDRPPAFCGRVRRLPFDEPDERLAPRQSGGDPGIRPVGPVLWTGRVRAGHPSSPGGPRSGPRRTGRQYPVTGCMPLSVPPTSVPRLAHRPSVPCTTRRPSQQRVSTPGGSQALSTPRWC
jgi:hypothetical protein